ncbi:MAG: substrate-binding domain-containing protein [Actinomycetota bacterium]|nr:substrate-binding domain-containing protein [Actinomycetota bacterium]
MKVWVTGALIVALIVTAGGCQSSASTNATEKFTLASTTSIQDSGLLAPLTALFEKDIPHYRVAVVAVGSGEAIQLARAGDADVLLTHSPEDEARFMRDGLGVSRQPVMQSTFVIAGPASDPAHIRQTSTVSEAFTSILKTSSKFISRGDGSGTHKREQKIWRSAGVEPKGDWYISTGQGQGESLDVAAQQDAYILTDLPTLLNNPKPRLKVLFDHDPILVNPYSVIPVKGAKHLAAAIAFANWITGTHARSFIASFGKSRFARGLFTLPAKPTTHA